MQGLDSKRSRRNFFTEGFMAAAALVAGSGLVESLSNCKNSKKGKKVKLLNTQGHIVEIDEDLIDDFIPHFPVSGHNVREGIPGKKWVMVIDLSKCRGAGKCLTGCSKMHYLPPQHSYIKLTKMQDSEISSPYWMPSPCFHCDNPPCVKVCPVGATFKLSDGIVGIDNNRCIGCRFCMAACPYSARVFNWGDNDFKVTPSEWNEILDWKKNHPNNPCTDHKKGTVEKCDFCPHNLERDILPDCVTSCPYGAIYFGNEYDDSISNGDETVRLSEIMRDKDGYRFLEDLGTKPRVYYLPPVNRQEPFEDRDLDRSKGYL